MAFVDFVLCTKVPGGRPVLYHAPQFSGLQKGDLVTVETENNMTGMMDVVSVITVDEEKKEMIDFIMRATGTSPNGVKKILSRVTFREFKYEEEKRNE